MPFNVRITVARARSRPVAAQIQRELHQELVRLWLGASRAFIRKVALEGVVKVDTGMSRASLLPLSRAVGLLTAVRQSITRDRASRGHKGAKGVSIGPNGRPRTIAAGIRAGENAFDFDVGTPQSPKFIFEFEIEVLQYLIREEGSDGITAWNSIIKGRRAFLTYFNKNASAAVRRGLDGLLRG